MSKQCWILLVYILLLGGDLYEILYKQGEMESKHIYNFSSPLFVVYVFRFWTVRDISDKYGKLLVSNKHVITWCLYLFFNCIHTIRDYKLSVQRQSYFYKFYIWGFLGYVCSGKLDLYRLW